MGVTQLPRATCPCVPRETILSHVQRQTEPCGHGGEEEEEEEEEEAAACTQARWPGLITRLPALGSHGSVLALPPVPGLWGLAWARPAPGYHNFMGVCVCIYPYKSKGNSFWLHLEERNIPALAGKPQPQDAASWSRDGGGKDNAGASARGFLS